MPSALEILHYTFGEEPLHFIPNDLYDLEITGLSKSDSGGKGDMAWTEGLGLEFSGTVLFFKGDRYGSAAAYVQGDTIHIPTDSPRLAFIRAANKFFPHLLKDDRIEIFARDTKLGRYTSIMNCVIGNNVTIGASCSIGFQGFGIEMGDDGYERFPHIGKVIIEDNVEIGSNVCIDRGALGDTIIKTGARIDNLVHIAHNVVVGENTAIVANAMIGGSAVIGDNVWIGPSASIMNGITIGDMAYIGMGAVVLKDVEMGHVMVGNPARKIR